VIGNNHHGAGPGHYLRADFRSGPHGFVAGRPGLPSSAY
jgi:hypothetical protein